MRTGSTYNAMFKGQHRHEFAWFHLSIAIPGVSMSAARAARQHRRRVPPRRSGGDPHARRAAGRARQRHQPQHDGAAADAGQPPHARPERRARAPLAFRLAERLEYIPSSMTRLADRADRREQRAPRREYAVSTSVKAPRRSRPRPSMARWPQPGLRPTSARPHARLPPASARPRPGSARAPVRAASPACDSDHLRPRPDLLPASSRPAPACSRPRPGPCPAHSRRSARLRPGFRPAGAKHPQNITRASRPSRASARTLDLESTRRPACEQKSCLLRVACGARRRRSRGRGGRRTRRRDAVRVDPPGRDPRVGDRRREGPFRFLLDTGSTHTAVTESLATAVDAVPVARTVMRAAAGSVACLVVALPTVVVDGVSADGLTATALPQAAAAGARSRRRRRARTGLPVAVRLHDRLPALADPLARRRLRRARDTPGAGARPGSLAGRAAAARDGAGHRADAAPVRSRLRRRHARAVRRAPRRLARSRRGGPARPRSDR